MSKIYEVAFQGGESAYRPGKACNYMMAKIPTDDLSEDIDTYPSYVWKRDDKREIPSYQREREDNGEYYVELYAEVIWDDDKDESEFDDYSYPILKDEILSQAKKLGVEESQLKFWWD